MRALLAPVLALVLLSGCAAPIQATRNLPQPQSLDEVNALLDGKHVTIELADGEEIRGVRSAWMRSTAVVYRTGGGLGRSEEQHTLPIAEVERITYVRNRGTRPGAIVGAVPGVALAGVGGGVYLAAGASDGPVAAVLGAVLLVGVGGVMTAIGAPLGGAIGSAVSPGGIVPLYEAPVERYLGGQTAVPDAVDG